MSQRCVTSKIYVSGTPVDPSRFSIWVDTSHGPLEVTSWKQLPDTQTPVIISEITALPPTAAMFDLTQLPPGYTAGTTSSSAARGRVGRNSSKIAEVFAEFPSNDTTRAALSQLIARPIPGHAILLTSPPGAGAVLAASTLAQELAVPESRFIASSDSDRWTVAEIDERVRRPAFYKPPEGSRNVVVILDADRMAPDAADRLLKTLEEPPQGTLFILTASNPRKLRPTIRGRLAEHVRIGEVPTAQRVEHYQSMGLASEQSVVLDSVCGPNMALASTIVSSKAFDAAITALDPGTRSPTEPVASARRQAKALEILASKVAPALLDSYATTSDDYDDDDQTTAASREKASKAATRILAHHVIDATIYTLHANVIADSAADAARLSAASHAVSYATDAKRAVNAYTPVERVLATFYSRLTAAKF